MLKEIYLQGNQLDSLIEDFTRLDSVEILDVSGNQFCNLVNANTTAWVTQHDPDWQASQVCP